MTDRREYFRRRYLAMTPEQREVHREKSRRSGRKHYLRANSYQGEIREHRALLSCINQYFNQQRAITYLAAHFHLPREAITYIFKRNGIYFPYYLPNDHPPNHISETRKKELQDLSLTDEI